MNRMWFLILTVLIGCGPKKEQPQSQRVLKAEYKRLNQEMERHIVRERWNNAEDTFQEILDLVPQLEFNSQESQKESCDKLKIGVKCH